MPSQSLIYSPVGGLNLTDDEDSLAPTEVRDASNMLFEGGSLLNRPGITTTPMKAGMSIGSIAFAQSFNVGATPLTVLIVGNKLYSLVLDLPTEITGAGITFGLAAFHGGAAVNGEILMANSTGGLVRWDPTGGTYVIVADAKYRYVTGHFSRALGAYDTTAANGDKKIGWCITGDIGDWTGVGSGSVILSDCPDDITGLGNINNVIVVPRRSGIHLGFPTGYGSLPFRWETWGRDGAGFPYPSTNCFFNNILYGVGKDDVYTYNLSDLTPIGYKIRGELLHALHAGVTYRGFISTLCGDVPRPRYNLVPSSNQWPHYVYDLADQKWSKHWYDVSFFGGFHHIPTYTTEGPALYGIDTIHRWTPELPCEVASWFLSRQIVLGDVEKDHRVNRMLLRYRDWGQYDINCTFNVTLGQERRSEAAIVSLGSAEASGRWSRAWHNFRLEGQDGDFRVDVPASFVFGTNLASIRITEGGEYRG